MTQQTGSLYTPLVTLVIFFGIFYFLLIRPQQQQQRKRRQMLAELKRGNQVVTIGGIYGEIVELRDESLTLKIADKVYVKLARSAVGRVLGKGEAQAVPEPDASTGVIE